MSEALQCPWIWGEGERKLEWKKVNNHSVNQCQLQWPTSEMLTNAYDYMSIGLGAPLPGAWKGSCMRGALKPKLHDLQEYPPPCLCSALTSPGQLFQLFADASTWMFLLCEIIWPQKSPLFFLLPLTHPVSPLFFVSGIGSTTHLAFQGRWLNLFFLLFFFYLFLLFHLHIHLFIKSYQLEPWVSFHLDHCSGLLAGFPASCLSSNSSST